VLSALCDMSLLVRRDGRLFLYESVRDLARTRLHPDAAGRAAVRHAAFYLERAGAWAASIRGADAVAALDAFDGDRDNVVAAYRFLVARDPAAAARLLVALDELLTLRGPFVEQAALLDEGEPLLGAVADRALVARLHLARGSAARRSGRLDDARRELGRGLARIRRAEPGLRAELLLALARTERIAGRAEGARLARRALACARRASARATVAAALDDLADVAGDVRLVRRSLEIARKDGDVLGRAYGEWTLGRILRDCGRPLEGTAVLEGALATARALGERRLVPLVLGSLGAAEHLADLGERAAATYAETAALHAANGHALMQAFALTNLAAVEHELGRLADARTHVGEALRLAREAGSARAAGIALAHLGALAGEAGRQEEARRLFGDAKRELEQARDPAALEALALLLAFAEPPGGAGAAAPGRARGKNGVGQPRSAAAPARSGRGRSTASAARRPLEVAIAERLVAAGRARARAPAAALGADPLLLAADARTVQVGRAAPVDLGRREALRRIVLRLAAEREHGPGEAVPAGALVAAGWPGERIDGAAAGNRLRNAIATLRRFGLRDVLLTRSDGYLLDPGRPLVRT
jgi:tetratricopeptide (TPR) repeat protein